MKEAARIIDAKKDKNGAWYWETMPTPSFYKIRAEIRVPPELPGIVIFVHGVNSRGERYDKAEEALMEGLNQRLGHKDLQPNHYLEKDPHYQSEEGNSPVIRFHCGYRAPEGREKDYLIPLRDRPGKSVWIKEHAGQWKCPQFWGGGPFQNGTNNLPQLWQAYGFKRRAWAAFVPINIQAMNSEWDRQLQDAPSREDYAHAAGRLAKMIDKIRRRYPGDTISVISHSQGTMIAMAAALLCKGRGPDALFLMNSPYALGDKVNDTMMSGDARPTNQARLTTLENLVRQIEQRTAAYVPNRLTIAACPNIGLSWRAWQHMTCQSAFATAMKTSRSGKS